MVVEIVEFITRVVEPPFDDIEVVFEVVEFSPMHIAQPLKVVEMVFRIIEFTPRDVEPPLGAIEVVFEVFIEVDLEVIVAFEIYVFIIHFVEEEDTFIILLTFILKRSLYFLKNKDLDYFMFLKLEDNERALGGGLLLTC